jgi:predicted Zn-ribbon and HTH transcriptional regulator
VASANRSAFDRRVKWIESFWKGTPAVVKVEEIAARNLKPHWRECAKNHLYVWVVRGKKADSVYVVKHRLEAALKLACHFDELMVTELKDIGVIRSSDPRTGEFSPHLCRECHEFSTRINIDGRCQDCHDKKEPALV